MKKNITIASLLVLAILMLIYFGGSLYYKDKFLERVYINEVKVGGMRLEEASKELMEKGGWEEIIVKRDTENFQKIKPEDIEYEYLGVVGLEEVFKEQDQWEWFTAIFNDSIHTIARESDYSKEKIRQKINEIEELDKKLLDARIVYSENLDEFVIESHSYEIKIDEEELLYLIVEAIESGDKEVNLEKYIEQPELYDDDEGLILAKNKANEYINFQIKYDFGDREEVLDRSVIKDFIVFEETEMKIDPEKVNEYIAELARKYDTFGGSRNFYTSLGEYKIVSGGSYGWLINRGETADELVEHLKNGKDQIIEPIYSYKALIRDLNDIGGSYVEIDLNNQMVYLYLNGQLMVQTRTVTGNILQGYATPTGVYPINYKERDATLEGEDYASPVKYWMPFNGHIGLHDADWRHEFGGDIYLNNGSHGCINLPPSNAGSIFDLVYPGMPVVVH